VSITNGNGTGPTDTVAIAQASAAERMAASIVLAFGACDDAGYPLTEVQQIAFVEAALLQFDGFTSRVRTLEGIGPLLRRLGHS